MSSCYEYIDENLKKADNDTLISFFHLNFLRNEDVIYCLRGKSFISE